VGSATWLTTSLTRATGVGFAPRFHHLVQQRLGPWLQALAHGVEHVGDLVHPAALFARSGEDVSERRPGTQGAVAGHGLRLVEAAVAQVAQRGRPGVGRLAVAVLDGQQLLDAVLAHPDHHQQAQLATAKG
jgi:hypothetical protein